MIKYDATKRAINNYKIQLHIKLDRRYKAAKRPATLVVVLSHLYFSVILSLRNLREMLDSVLLVRLSVSLQLPKDEIHRLKDGVFARSFPVVVPRCLQNWTGILILTASPIFSA